MNRLTKNNYCDDTLYLDTKEQIVAFNHSLYNKLKTYEDIEEELGVDLSILKKVLEHGQEKYVYFKDRDGKIHKCDRAIINIHICVDVLDEPVGSGYFCQKNLYLDDYGKTWALDKNELTREELENEK